MSSLKKKIIALVPDRFAHYRYPVFKALSDFKKNDYLLHIYADTTVSSNIELADPSFANMDFDCGNVFWVPVKNSVFKSVCFWQTGVIKVALCDCYDMVVYWGDAWRVSTWISAALAKIKKKKVVFWTHGIYGNESRLKLWFRLLFYRMGDALLLYGEHAKELLIAEGFDESKLFVINNSLDFELQRKIYLKVRSRREEIRFFREDTKVIVFVGRLEKNKKLEMLMHAVSNINSLGENIALLLIGGGLLRSQLEVLASDLGVTDYVKFYGACYDQEELAPLIMGSDICVSPGNVGLTAMQSLGYGIPVVTHSDPAQQMPEYEAIIEGSSGAMFDYGSQQSLERAILRCMKYLGDGSINASTCIEVVEKKYTPEYQLKIFNNVFNYLYAIDK